MVGAVMVLVSPFGPVRSRSAGMHMYPRCGGTVLERCVSPRKRFNVLGNQQCKG